MWHIKFRCLFTTFFYNYATFVHWGIWNITIKICFSYVELSTTLNWEIHCINVSNHLICKIHIWTCNFMHLDILYDTTARTKFPLCEKTHRRPQLTTKLTWASTTGLKRHLTQEYTWRFIRLLLHFFHNIAVFYITSVFHIQHLTFDNNNNNNNT
jgi:hypothetical protein